MKKLIFIIFSAIVFNSYAQTIPTDSLYFGQKIPGKTPVKFAPNIISKPGSYEHDITFSPDGMEMFYCISQPDWADFKIYQANWSTDHWTKPVLADFSQQYKNTEISYSPDGQSLLFASNRAPGAEPWNFAIIKLTKNAGKWTSPTEIGIKALQPTGNDGNWHPSITNDSILYFSSYASGFYHIYYTKLKNGVATNFVKMGNGINSSSNDLYPFIAPDNSYLIFSSDRPGGYGLGDLYVSFRKVDNSWTIPKNLGSTVNTSGEETSSRISSDGKFLFFTLKKNWEGDFYWMSTNIIDEIKKQTLGVSAKGIEKSDAQTIEIYPNPSSGIFNINIGDASAKKAEVEIYDFSGKLLLRKELDNWVVDLTNYQKGIYLIGINIDRQKINKKIVIE